MAGEARRASGDLRRNPLRCATGTSGSWPVRRRRSSCSGVEARPERLAHVLGVGMLAGREAAGHPAVEPAGRTSPLRRSISDGARTRRHAHRRHRAARPRTPGSSRGAGTSSCRVRAPRGSCPPTRPARAVRSTPSSSGCSAAERVESEARREHAEMAEQPLLGLVQQRVAPVDGSRHRLVTGFAPGGPGGQVVGGVAQLSAQLVEAPAAHLPRRQLDREGKPVESGAEVDDLRCPRRPTATRGSSSAGPFDEQLGGGGAEGLDGNQVLLAESERFPAGGQDAPRRRRGRARRRRARRRHRSRARSCPTRSASTGRRDGRRARRWTATASPSTPSASASAREHVARRAGRYEVDEHGALRPALQPPGGRPPARRSSCPRHPHRSAS